MFLACKGLNLLQSLSFDNFEEGFAYYMKCYTVKPVNKGH
jgi:hypothetical protein